MKQCIFLMTLLAIVHGTQPHISQEANDAMLTLEAYIRNNETDITTEDREAATRQIYLLVESLNTDIENITIDNTRLLARALILLKAADIKVKVNAISDELFALQDQIRDQTNARITTASEAEQLCGFLHQINNRNTELLNRAQDIKAETEQYHVILRSLAENTSNPNAPLLLTEPTHRQITTIINCIQMSISVVHITIRSIRII